MARLVLNSNRLESSIPQGILHHRMMRQVLIGGESWRMPTKTEWQELSDKCTWTWTTQNETDGYKVTGPNGQSIFFPAAGNKGEVLYSSGEVGAYWSSTVYSSTDYALDKDDAYSMNFNNRYHNVDWGYRIYGKSVRPVTE